MKLRILTALPLAAIVIWIIGWAPPWVFFLTLLIAVETGLNEFFRISRHAGFVPFSKLGYATGALLCLAQAGELNKNLNFALSVLIFDLLCILSLGLASARDLKQYMGSVAVTLFGVIYIAVTLSWLLPIRFSVAAGGREQILFLFVVIWAGDIFAYFIGRSVGRTPLVPRISPKKTVEGAIAGLAGSLLAGWTFAHWFWKLDLKTVILLAGPIAMAGQVGDLVESALKRSADMKDSGSMLPGHGGILDRIDSLLFGAPVFWLVLALRDVQLGK